MSQLTSAWELKSGRIIRNHFVLAPMVNRQSEADGSVGDNELQWLLRRAQGGFGMIITSATNVLPAGQTWANQLSVHSDKHIVGLTNLASALSEAGSVPILQIFDGGARAPSSLTGEQPRSASAFTLDIPNFEQPRALTLAEIYELITAFVDGAKRAYQAGFAGIEIHSANGYLLNQFISTQTNQREDEFGGSLTNRARLVRMILHSCKQALPADFIIGVRLSPENRGIQAGLDLDETVQIAKWLAEDGADYIHLSTSDVFKRADKYPEDERTLIDYFQAVLGNTPLLAAGNLQTIEQMERAYQAGVSGVALGRIAIANPDIPLHASEDGYQPLMMPYTREHLESVKVSTNFYEYLLPYPNFIATSDAK